MTNVEWYCVEDEEESSICMLKGIYVDKKGWGRTSLAHA